MSRRRIRVLLYRAPWRNSQPYFRVQQVAAHFRKRGDRVVVVAGPRGWRSLVRLLLWPWHLIQAELVFLYPQPLLPLFVLTAAWLGRRVVIDHFVSYVRTADVRPRAGRWLNRMERAAYRRADVVLAHTDSMAEALRNAFALPEDNVSTLYCVVDTELFAPTYGQRAMRLRQKLGVDDRFVILYHGFWHPWHGLDTLRDAVASLVDAGEHIALVMIGYEVSGRAHERFLHKVSYAELPAYIQMADLWCSGFANLPRGDRSLSSTMIQALALGRPVITSPSIEKVSWLRYGETAFFVRPCDAEALAHGIRYCRDHPDVARRVGEAGRHLAQESFGIGVMHKLLNGLARAWFGEGR